MSESSPGNEILRQAIRAIIIANDYFREGMPAKWEGDPLQDAIEQAAKLLLLPAQRMPERALLLIQQLAWYYDVNDCGERHEDDALEIPLLDLKVAKQIATELMLPTGPTLVIQRVSLSSTESK